MKTTIMLLIMALLAFSASASIGQATDPLLSMKAELFDGRQIVFYQDVEIVNLYGDELDSLELLNGETIYSEEIESLGALSAHDVGGVGGGG